MKTQYYTASSLDGYIADPRNSLDWLFQFDSGSADDPGADYADFIREIGAIAMGSTTYEWILSHQVFPEDGPPGPWPYEQPCWVFTTRTLRAVEGAQIEFVAGDVGAVHAEMARAAKGLNIWIAGGGDLVGQFHDQGLLDEVIVTFAPVTLGGGAPLLPRRIVTPPLKLLSTSTFGGIFVQHRYAVQTGG